MSGGRYLAVNRAYKPLGGLAGAWVDYDTHPQAVKFKRLTADTIAKLSIHGEPDSSGRIYLYDDGCIPTSSPAHWTAYAGRLGLLARLKIE